MRINFHENGRIYVIYGPMFSGKTLELLNTFDFIRHSSHPWQIFKPDSEYRPELHGQDFPSSWLVSRGFNDKPIGMPATTVPENSVTNMFSNLNPEVVRNKGYIGIDEAIHFKGDLIGLVKELTHYGVSVVISGLNMDFRGEPFAPVPELMALSSYHKEKVGVCMSNLGNGKTCDNDGTHSMRVYNGEPAPYDAPITEIGTNQYKVVCGQHHIVPGRPTKFNLEELL